MVKENKIPLRRIQFLLVILVIFLILIGGYPLGRFLYNNFIKENSYLIENKYYGFQLQTPGNWIAKEKTTYLEDSIFELLADCKNDKTNNNSVYEIGAFRFEDKRHPDSFGEMGYLPTGLSSGAVLEVTVNCVPDSIKSKIENIPTNFKVAGEKAFEQFLDLMGFGKTKYIYLFHGSLQYRIIGYIYISPDSKGYEEKIRENYTNVFDKIISSFEFTK